MALALAYSRKSAQKELGGEPYSYAIAIAYVDGGKNKFKKLWLNPDGYEGETRIDLPPDSHFVLEPPHAEEHRQYTCIDIWVFGKSGSGESTTRTLRSYARRDR